VLENIVIGKRKKESMIYEIVPDYDWISETMELTGYDYSTVAFAYFLLNAY
jgi:hypothetical protein